jgi:hypothetical protein
MVSVSMIRSGEPVAPVTATVMVSTYTPGVSPAVLRLQATVPLPVPLEVVSVVQLFLLLAVHLAAPAPSPVRVTVPFAAEAAVPCWADAFREEGVTANASGTGAAVMVSVSMIRPGEPVAPVADTVMVSTYTPGVSPAVLRLQATVPLPVPFAVVSVVQLFRLVAVHLTAPAPAPVNVTLALPSGPAAPATTVLLRDAGLTVSAKGTGAAVMVSVSMIRPGEPVAPVADTVIVSTYTPGLSPAVLRFQATVPLPVPLEVVSVIQLFLLLAVHLAAPAPSPVRVTVPFAAGAAVPC